MTVQLDVQCPYRGQSRHTYDPEEAILEIDQPCEHLCVSMSWSTENLVEDVEYHPAFEAEAAEDALVDLPDWILCDRFPGAARSRRGCFLRPTLSSGAACSFEKAAAIPGAEWRCAPSGAAMGADPLFESPALVDIAASFSFSACRDRRLEESGPAACALLSIGELIV